MSRPGIHTLKSCRHIEKKSKVHKTMQLPFREFYQNHLLKMMTWETLLNMIIHCPSEQKKVNIQCKHVHFLKATEDGQQILCSEFHSRSQTPQTSLCCKALTQGHFGHSYSTLGTVCNGANLTLY